MFHTVLFDLDGTLTDPFEGITKSAAYALKRFQIEVPDRRELTAFIGPPLLDSFRNLYGLSKADAMRAIGYYREYYEETGIFENVAYPVVPALTKLKERGICLAVATSKPEHFSKRILEHFALDGFFTFVAGATIDERRTHKDEVIAYALEKLKIREPSRVVMVGDRKYDVLGAKANGLKSVGVLYGYGDREELTLAGADYLAKTPDEVQEAILNERL